MKYNIVPHASQLLVLPDGDWPIKPEYLEYHSIAWYKFYSESHNFMSPEGSWKMDCDAYQRELAAALAVAIPIVEEDYRKVRWAIWNDDDIVPPNPRANFDTFKLEDDTTYECDLDLEKVEQFRIIGHDEWYDKKQSTRLPEVEYRTAFRLKQEKDEEFSPHAPMRKLGTIIGKFVPEGMSPQPKEPMNTDNESMNQEPDKKADRIYGICIEMNEVKDTENGRMITGTFRQVSPPSHEKVEEKGWIKVSDKMPETEVILMTTSQIQIIGDWYKGEWRTHRSRWVREGDTNRLKSAFEKEDIVAWHPLPEIPLWKPTTQIGNPPSPTEPEEGQEELWNQMFEILLANDEEDQPSLSDIENVKSKFTLKRKP